MSKHKLGLETRAGLRLMGLSFTLCILSLALPLSSFGQSALVRQANFLPPEILDIDMGVSAAWLLERIKNSGTHSSRPLARPNRIKITWAPNSSPYYSQVDFMFTEKDRLYLIRFSVNDESRWNVNSLKKQFADKFHFSADQPSRFRIQENDTIVYPPASGGKSHFFEVTEISGGKKFLELFEKNIDLEDRPPVKPANAGEKKEDPKAGAQPGK